jgi:Domain of unknown function (DUF5615)
MLQRKRDISTSFARRALSAESPGSTDIVAAHDLGGLTPEEIAASVYPELTLAQVSSALACYDDHRDEIEQAMQNEAQYIERLLQNHPQLLRDIRPAKTCAMLKGYADERVVFGLVQALRQPRTDAVRVQDRDREQADDADLLDEALADGRLMLTNDTEFLALAVERAARQERYAPIFFWPQQRRSIGQLVQSIIRDASRHDYDSACSHAFFL